MKTLSKTLTHALLVSTLVCQATAFAQAGSNPLANAKGSQIVGVYDVNVDLYTCDTHDYVTSFPAMHKYELGGTGQLLPAGSSPAIPVHMLVWEYLGDNHYSTATKFFRYNAGGLVGSTVITAEVWVSEDGALYGGAGISELYDLGGNLVGVAGCPEFSGTRFTGGF